MIRRIALALCLAAGVASAQMAELNQGGPIEVTARDGIEWRQNEQVVIARGAARAVRGGVTIDADLLLARYRPRGGTPAEPRPASEGPGGASEIWRLEAEGNVVITTHRIMYSRHVTAWNIGRSGGWQWRVVMLWW